VATHVSPEAGGIWVTFRGGVYDITEFIQNHPGGVDKIKSAAGGSLEPYWSLYRQHLKPAESPSSPGAAPVPKDHVAEILGPLQIGWLDPAEAAAAAAAAAARADDDPYKNEPSRHPALRMLSETPCSAESPAHLLGDSWLTPSALFYVRNHHPVPQLDPSAFALEVTGPGLKVPVRFSLEQLKAMPRHTITATIQCGGNRRCDMNEVRKTSGNAWGVGAISNAAWTGVQLRHVLAAAGVATEEQLDDGSVAHVQFEGDDGTKASIPAEKATRRGGDVLLAYEMNGELLPPDHGFPLRAVVPGHVGVRSIKWLTRVVASEAEAEGVWQRGMAYKAFGPHVTSLEGVDVGRYAPIQEMPVQSAILSPQPNAPVAELGESLSVKGLAWSGGGRGIVRVDVSADGGATWHTASLGEGAHQPVGRAWAWTFWEADVPVTTAGGATIVCKAVDEAHNSQPESAASEWNLRGLANNAWHRVPIREAAED
jgi:sulfite oxidase